MARVEVKGRERARIGRGLLVLVGVEEADTERDAEMLARKVTELRIFEDDEGRMNRSLIDTAGQLLAVSQFTLLGDSRKGRRPSFQRAAPPEVARHLYNRFLTAAEGAGIAVATGIFQETMEVELINSGPVTLLLDTQKAF